MKIAYATLAILIFGAVLAISSMLLNPPLDPAVKCQKLKAYHEQKVGVAQMCMQFGGLCVVTYSDLEDLIALEQAKAEACGETAPGGM